MKRKGLLATLFVSTIACVAGATAFITQAETDIQLPEKVYVGETVELPERTIEHDGQEKNGSVIITAPDGKKYTTGDVFTAEMGGKYTVEYYAYFDGEKVTLPKESVIAVRKAVDLLETEQNTTIEEGAFLYREGVEGVRVMQGIGGGVTLAKTVDISKNTRRDVIAEVLVEPTRESSDFADLYVTITDAHDETNSISIKLIDSGSTNFNGKGCYVKAAATGQTYAGGGYGAGYIIDTKTGTPLWMSYRTRDDADWTYPSVKIYYDYADKAIYASASGEENPEIDRQTLIADLDAPNFPSDAWSGFTDGKVNIGVSAGGLLANEAKYFVLNIGGYDLSLEEFEDEVAPTISIDYAGEVNIPMAVVGEKYKVFNAKLEDNLDNDIQLDVQAFYLHSNGKKYDVSVKDGYMETPYGGNYVIRYTATDRTGNFSVEEVYVSTLTAIRPIVLTTTDENKEVDYYGYATIGGVASLSAEGGSGNIRYSVEVRDPDGESVSLENNRFRATKVGTYTVTYKALDYLGQEVKIERTVVSKAPVKPIFVSEKKLPEGLVKGFTYTFPKFEAKELGEGNAIVDVTVDTYVNGEKYNDAFVATGTSVTVQYVATGMTGTTYSAEYVLSVVDGNDGKDQTQYFLGENVALTENKENVAVSFSQDAKVSFVSALSSYNFQTAFAWADGECGFRQMKIKLSDAQNKDLTVTLALSVSSEKVILSYPHSDLEYTFANTAGSYKFNYNNLTYKIKDITGADCGKITYDDNGALFKGFSDEIYFSVEFVSVSAESNVQFSALNNQTLGYRKKNYDNRLDEIEPQIILDDNYSVKQEVGTKVQLPYGNAYDVLSEVVSFTCSVTAPNKTFVLQNAPANAINEIELTQAGIYKIDYVAVDSNGNTATVPRLIRCVEKQAPQFAVESAGIKQEYALNETFKLPTYIASDNSGTCYVDVMLMLPDGEMWLLTHDKNGDVTSHLNDYVKGFKVSENEFALLQKGEYLLRYFAYDDTYNYAMVDFVFTVK